MRWSANCALVVTYCVVVLWTVSGFAQQRVGTPQLLTPAIPAPSLPSKKLELDLDQKRKVGGDKNLLQNLNDVKAKETKGSRDAGKSSEGKLLEQKKLPASENTGTLKVGPRKFNTEIEKKDKDQNDKSATTTSSKSPVDTGKDVKSTGSQEPKYALLRGCEHRGGGVSDCLKAIKDCAAKGDATGKCVNESEDNRKVMSRGCRGPDDSGLKGGACTQVVKDCMAKGDATEKCVKKEASALQEAEYKQEKLKVGCRGPDGSGLKGDACTQVVKDCMAKGDATEKCVKKEASALQEAEYKQEKLKVGCRGPDDSGLKGDACSQVVKDCMAKGDASENCVRREAFIEQRKEELANVCSRGLGLSQGVCARAAAACLTKGKSDGECVEEEATNLAIQSPDSESASPVPDKRV
jgi:hypothetical protein